MTQHPMILAGDIGGTKTRLAVFSSESGPKKIVTEATFPSPAYPGLAAIVHEFLSRIEMTVDSACFGVAGPVMNGRAKVTNLPWEVSERELADALNISHVCLINDLTAVALAIPDLGREDVLTLNAGSAVSGGAIAVIAAGTGLGQAYLVWDGSRYLSCPSEGGHADFAPRDALEARLMLYLLNRFGHVSIEHVCSGIGIRNLYEFLKESECKPEPLRLAERLATVRDPVPAIMAAALDGERPCPICRETLDRFISILGAEAGNAALRTMATGGVYLGGGIPPRILPELRKETFMKAFRDKGRLSGFMEAFPVHVILNSETPLRGAAIRAFEPWTTAVSA